MFIPSVSTGDSVSPFNEQNAGYWSVLSISGTNFSATRLPTVGFSGVSEVVSVASSAEVFFFSTTGVQVGNTLDILGGFSSVTRNSYIVSNVTSEWVEFVSTEAIPLESSVLVGVNGMVFYSSAKRWVRIESDQPLVLRFNGSSWNDLKIKPRANGLSESVGWFDSWGLFYSLEIVNLSKISFANIVITMVE